MSISNAIRPHSDAQRNFGIGAAVVGGTGTALVLAPTMRWHKSDKVIDQLTNQINTSLKSVAHRQLKSEDALGETIKNVEAWQKALPAVRAEAHVPIGKLGLNAAIGAAAGYVLIVGGKNAWDAMFKN